MIQMRAKRRKKSKKKIKSGIKARASDSVRKSQRYPQAQLRFQFVSANVTFDKLDLNLFVHQKVRVPSNLRDRLLQSTKKKNKNETNDTEEKLWFCSQYQRNKCHSKGSHILVIKGQARHAQHICASCWQKDSKKLEHPECSSACPHYSQ